MGAEQSQQRPLSDYATLIDNTHEFASSASSSRFSASTGAIKKRLRNIASEESNQFKANNEAINSPGTTGLSRSSSPPLSVCSDVPYISYTTDKPIGDSPKMRGRPGSSLLLGAGNRSSLVLQRPNSAPKPRRPQSTSGIHNIVVVKAGRKDAKEEIENEIQQLQRIPQFLPVLRNSITNSAYTKDFELFQRFPIQPHMLNISSRLQTHLNTCATQIAQEQSQLVERTKIVSNSITTLFASFVEMQKAYSSYAEHFAKVRLISQQLSRCNSLLHENIASLETINNFLSPEERLEPFVWRTDDNKLRGAADGATGTDLIPVHSKRL